jgi:hypothetical protein
MSDAVVGDTYMGMSVYRLHPNDVTALAKGKFSEVCWARVVWGFLAGSVAGFKASVPQPPTLFTLLPGWYMHLDAIARALRARGVSKASTDTLVGILQGVAVSNCANTEVANNTAENMLSDYMKELEEHFESVVTRARNTRMVGGPDEGCQANRAFAAFLKRKQEQLKAEQANESFGGVSPAPKRKAPETAPPRPAKGAKSQSTPPKEKKRDRSDLVVHSANGKYLKIGSVCFDAEKLRQDIESDNALHGKSYPTSQLEGILGLGKEDKRRTLIAPEKLIPAALKYPWAGFNPAVYKLPATPGDFGAPL